MGKITIFMAGPHHDNRVHVGAARGFWLATRKHNVIYKPEGSSLLARNFNLLWAKALEARDAGECTHFGMVHADIEAEPWWADALLAELALAGADVMAAVVPVKDGHGLTSTAVDNPADPWRVARRLTMSEVMELPDPFGAADACPGRMLLVNTGLWIADLRRPWVDRVETPFTIQDRIVKDRMPDGRVRRRVETIPEDWHFSRQVQAAGGVVMATRRVVVVHHGDSGWTNQGGWGAWKWDEEFADGPLGEAGARPGE